jgi:hypothetical protein
VIAAPVVRDADDVAVFQMSNYLPSLTPRHDNVFTYFF